MCWCLCVRVGDDVGVWGVDVGVLVRAGVGMLISFIWGFAFYQVRYALGASRVSFVGGGKNSGRPSMAVGCLMPSWLFVSRRGLPPTTFVCLRTGCIFFVALCATSSGMWSPAYTLRERAGCFCFRWVPCGVCLPHRVASLCHAGPRSAVWYCMWYAQHCPRALPGFLDSPVSVLFVGG